MGRPTSACSRGSSLAVSALSTPETATREVDSPTWSKDDGAAGKPAMQGGEGDCLSSTVIAQLDISHFLAPLEARLVAHIDAMEATVERRCTALERQIGRLAGAACGDPAYLQQHLDSLQAQMDMSREYLESHVTKHDELITTITKQVQACYDRHANLQCNVSEVWRQVKVDRQDGLQKFQGLSDALETRLRGLCERVDSALSDAPAPLAYLEGSLQLHPEERLVPFPPKEIVEDGDDIVRSRSSPSPAMGRLPPRFATAPSGALSAALAERIQRLRNQEAPQQQQPQPLFEDEGGHPDSAAPAIARFSTVPAPVNQQRSNVARGQPAPQRSIGSPTPSWAGAGVQRPGNQPVARGQVPRVSSAHEVGRGPQQQLQPQLAGAPGSFQPAGNPSATRFSR